MCHWTQNSLTCAIEVGTHSDNLINLQMWKQGRSELTVEIGTWKLGQGRSEPSHVKWHTELRNSELGTHTIELGTCI